MIKIKEKNLNYQNKKKSNNNGKKYNIKGVRFLD
jgi:hypothetical protein